MPFRAERVCPGCGESFTARANNAKFCSIACRKWVGNGHTELRVSVLACAECGDRIESPRPGKKFCSTKCKLRASEKRRDRDDASRYLQERDRRLTYAKEYAKRNPHVGQATKRRRRAAIRASGAYRFTGADWKRCVDRLGGRCFYCGEIGPMTMDHVVPVVRGGTHGAGNIVPACMSCNCHKQGRTVAEWRHGRKRGGGAIAISA